MKLSGLMMLRTGPCPASAKRQFHEFLPMSSRKIRAAASAMEASRELIPVTFDPALDGADPWRTWPAID
jgi:hypothetical protein